MATTEGIMRNGEFRRVPWRRLLAAGVVVLVLSIGPALPAWATPGDLDPTFGASGTVISTAGEGPVNALVLQPDGKLVAAGGNFALARFNTDGSLDPTFGGGGKMPPDFSGIEVGFSALVLQPDGKLVAAGFREDGGGQHAFAVARHNADGSLDSTFGGGGKVITHFSNGSHDLAFALVLQPDGKLVAAGYSLVSGDGGGGFWCFPFCPPPSPDTVNFALARYNADGTLDSTFGGGGKVITHFGGFNDQVLALVLQPDGKLVAAGGSNGNFALARYNADGHLDSSFGVGGRVITNFGNSGGAASALVLQPDGKLVAAGSGIPDFALARYNADGSLDSTFGSGGKVITDFGGGEQASALVLQPDGKLVAAGESCLSGLCHDFALARYNTDGSLDASFGAAGKVITHFGSSGGAAYALVLQPDGKLVAGGSGPCTVYSCNFILTRYQGDLAVAAAVSLNGSDFHTAQTITYQATLTPGSTPTQVDIYLGVLLPDGMTFLSFVPGPGGTIAFAFGPVPVPFAANVPLTPTVVPFSYTFTGGEPVGTYFTYAGLAIAGSNPLLPANRLGLAVQSFQFNPSFDDTTPDPFTFTDVTGVPLSTVQTSNAVIVSGITAPAAISIVGGTYERNSSGVWSSSAGTVANGDTVRVHHTSAATNSTAVNTTLTIGGVSDTFTSTTLATVGVSQSFDPSRPGAYSNLVPSEPFHQQMADNFFLFQTTTFESISWFGRYDTILSMTNPVAFSIRFFADAGGHPAVSPLAVFDVSVNALVTGLTFNGTLWFSYSTPLALTLEPGTYWVSVVESDPRTPANASTQWLWGQSNTNGALAFRSSDSTTWTGIPALANPDQAFTLTSATATTTITEFDIPTAGS